MMSPKKWIIPPVPNARPDVFDRSIRPVKKHFSANTKEGIAFFLLLLVLLPAAIFGLHAATPLAIGRATVWGLIHVAAAAVYFVSVHYWFRWLVFLFSFGVLVETIEIIRRHH